MVVKAAIVATALSIAVSTGSAFADKVFGEWKVGISDFEFYLDLESYGVAKEVCIALWEDAEEYLLISLVPHDIRIIQVSNRNWTHLGSHGLVDVEIGSVILNLSNAIFKNEFIDHFTEGTVGPTHFFRDLPILLDATGSNPSNILLKGQEGEELLRAPFAGFLQAIESLYECYEINAAK